MTKRLVLLDGNSLLFRAFYALPLLNNTRGIYTNAIFGFTRILLKILEEEKPSHILVAFDAGKTTFRHKAYKDYKGGRQKTPPELSEQFPLSRQLLDAFQISHYELDLYEADDIIGTLTEEAVSNGLDVKVISGDQDMLQLVSDQVTVDITRKGVSDVESYTPQFVLEKMELTPEQIIDLKALMGDKSDNIPGVPGVGIKTATRLLKQYGTLDNIYENIDEISGKKLKENLLEHKDEALLSRELVTIKRDSPLKIDLQDTKYDGFNKKSVLELFKELEFNSLIKEIGGEPSESDELDDITYEVVDLFKSSMITGKEAIHFEMITENYHQARIEAIGIVNDKNAYIISLENALQSVDFKTWLEDETKEKIVFDSKATLVTCLNHDIELKGVTFDLLLAAYLLNPSERNDDIPTIAHRLNYRSIKTDEEIYGKGARKQVPAFEVVADHVVRKTDVLYKLQERFVTDLEENDQADLFNKLELPLAMILGKMEYIGFKVNRETLHDMGKELAEQIEVIEQRIYKLAGEKFNVNSPQQLSKVLFETLELPVIRKTKTGYSTAADVLEKLEDKHEIIPEILHYRQLKKLHSTYVEGLLKVINEETSKIHTRFNQALTQTGRLSSIEPNLQNIPIRLEEGRKIRKAFVPADENWSLIAADYSQIELRVLAHISGDERLMMAFKQDLDIHTQTAADVFHVELNEVTETMREQAKAVNFGIVYGISDYGLSQNLKIPRKEAKEFIEKYFSIYPDVKEYMDIIVKEAKHKGYVTTIMNRRRYLPEITSRNFNQRSFAERTAMNTPIQGSAADIIKRAMIDLDQALTEYELSARVLLQVHDELILEAPEHELDELYRLVPSIMEKTITLNVPLKVDISSGKTWFDL